MLLHLEFLHIVRRGNVNDPAPAPDGIPGAIQQECGGPKETAAKVEERDILVGCALRPAGLNKLPLRIVDRRVQLNKVKYVAKIERHLRYHF